MCMCAMPFLARKNPSMNTFIQGPGLPTSSFAGRLGLFDVQEIGSERQNRFEFFQKEDRCQKRIHYITHIQLIKSIYYIISLFKFSIKVCAFRERDSEAGHGEAGGRGVLLSFVSTSIFDKSKSRLDLGERLSSAPVHIVKPNKTCSVAVCPTAEPKAVVPEDLQFLLAFQY